MEQDAAVIALKRTGISIPQRKRQAHRLAAVIMLKRTGIFVPQRKLSCNQAFSFCERGYTYRLGVNYSTFVPLFVYQIYLCTTTATCGLPTQIRRARLNSIRLMIISNDHSSNKTNLLRE